MLRLPDRRCEMLIQNVHITILVLRNVYYEMFELPNVDTKCSYYDIGVTKYLLRCVCYEMCELRFLWQPVR